MDNIVQDLGVVGVLSIALMFVLRYLTQTLSWEVKNIHTIVVKLIDKINKDPNDYPGGYKERVIRMHREAAGLYPQNHPRGGDKDLLKNPGH